MMKERPILFSAPMINAILDGRKAQTRRLVQPQPAAPALFDGMRREMQGGKMLWYRSSEVDTPFVYWVSRHGEPGDRLWVRETWRQAVAGEGINGIAYRADFIGNPEDANAVAWRPSIFMPRWASRITLEIAAVRVERLQDITDKDALAEGVDRTNTSIPGYAKERFRRLWEQINGKKAGWDANPWVWVIEFKRLEAAREAGEVEDEQGISS